MAEGLWVLHTVLKGYWREDLDLPTTSRILTQLKSKSGSAISTHASQASSTETCHSTVLTPANYPFDLIIVLVLVVIQNEEAISFSLDD
jgi:hypothetical protein